MVKRRPAPRPPGTRHFELPYTATAPRLVNPDLGIAGIVRRGGEFSYAMDVTLLDAPDSRLLRSGVVLAHRVVDSRGEWYLDAPGWAPWLPVDEIEQMGHAELPERFADLVRPFRRWATLGPVAALECDRAEFLLRDAKRRTLAVVRDDRVTASRSGLTFNRYREVTIRPVRLTRDQLAWLTETIQLTGGTRLRGLPHVLERVGASKVSLQPSQDPPRWEPDTDLESFVATLIGYRRRQLLAADLMTRSGHGDASLTDVAGRLRGELNGLASVLDPLWLQDIDAELAWAAEALGSVGSLHAERYLRLLDSLVSAERGPRLGGAGGRPAAEVLQAIVEQQFAEFKAAGRPLSATAADQLWLDAALHARQLLNGVAVAELLMPEWAGRIARRARRLAALLGGAEEPELSELGRRYLVGQPVPDPAPREAFAAGRRYQQLLDARSRARREALAQWPVRMTKLQAAVRR